MLFDPIASAFPATVRKWIYTIFGTFIAVESTLDLFEYGVLAEKPTSAMIAVMATLGFGMAVSKTKDVEPEPEVWDADNV